MWSFEITGPVIATRGKEVNYVIKLMQDGMDYGLIPIPPWVNQALANIPGVRWALFESRDPGSTSGSFYVTFPESGSINLTVSATSDDATICVGSIMVEVSEPASQIDAQILGNPVVGQQFQMALMLKNGNGVDFSSMASLAISATDPSGTCNGGPLPATINAQQGQALVTLNLTFSSMVTISSPGIESPFEIFVELGDPV
jgi:hypothetical protein